MKQNNIGWCDITVNPVQGCPRGCVWNESECYAKLTWNRHKGQPGWAKDFSKPEFFPDRLKGFRTKRPLIIFIDSMSDIGWWGEEWFDATAKAMHENPHNIYLALTKELRWAKDLTQDYVRYGLLKSFYLGATVTNNAQAKAVINAGGADFISFEPLLERIEPLLLTYLKCKWWIVGDLTKNGKPQRVIKAWQVFEMADRASELGMPLFMKESLNGLCGSFMKQEFPAGWKTHKHAETEVHNYAE
jgi:protein gp37